MNDRRPQRRTRRSAALGVTVALTVTLVAASCAPVTRTPRPDTPVPPPGTALLPAHLDCLRWRYEGLEPVRPAEWDDRGEYRLGSFRDPSTANSPHRLCGQVGSAADLAWALDRGRSDVVIAILDSGIEWRNRSRMSDLADQTYINAGELPIPIPAGTGGDPHDSNGDGRFTVSDYSRDPRVRDRNASGFLDPEDLILTFSDGIDADGNSYVDDISGWDLQNNDNNPLDDVDYGHGSGEARDAVAAHDGSGSYGTCPECLVLHIRVADSFIAEGGRFAAGVLFGLDAGADVVLEALGAISNPPQVQAAIDAAYRRGVPVAASMADEQSQHANLPAAMNHTIPMNSITELTSLSTVAKELGGRREAQLLNGCTNYGGITWVSVPSTGCSSQATGSGGGMLGLINAAAKTAGVPMHPDLAALGLSGPGQNVLSANETAQLVRAGADDINFASPNSVDPANEFTDEFGQPRFPSVRGWDATHGYGQFNLYESVRAVQEGRIPPEADITEPEFFEMLPVTGSVEVRGRVAAVRSSEYDYRVEWTTGLQTGPHPAVDDWRIAEQATGLTAPVDGLLGTIDLADVAAALPGGGRGTPSDTRGRPLPDRFTVRIRVVVTDDRGLVGTMHRLVQVHDDPVRSTYTEVPGAGASSPVFADLDRDGADELVLSADDGAVHAIRADGSPLPGWPARTLPAPYWNPDSPTAIADGIPAPGRSISVGAPAVADLDADGELEVVVTDLDGGVTVFRADGTVAARAQTDPDFSRPEATDRYNRMKPGIMGGASLGDLDADGDLEVVVAAQDRHVYAFHHDGSGVAGFPVLLVDPMKITAVDPVTEAVTFADTRRVGQGGELIATPTLADLTGDGRPEIIVGAQEQYTEPINIFPAIGMGNSRLYALSSSGSLFTAGRDRSPVHPDDHAYLPGWPVAVPMAILQILPAIGQGVSIQAAAGDVDGDGQPEVAAVSAAGQYRVYERDGTSAYGGPTGIPFGLTWFDATPPGTNSTDTEAVLGAFGGPALGRVVSRSGLDIAGPTSGMRRGIDTLAPNRQADADPQMTVWRGSDGSMLPGFPRVTADLAFFVTPAIADVDGDGRNEVVAGNGVHTIDAFGARGPQPAGWPKLTGGWVVGTPGFGDWDGDGTAEVAVVRRDGRLLVWDLPTPSDAIGDWIRSGGDDRNSGSR